MYALETSKYDGTEKTVLFSPDFTLERWSRRISAAGKLVFSIPAYHPKATDATLGKSRRVRLHREKRDGSGASEPAWYGYIEQTNELDGRLEVICVGMLQFFAKRFTAVDESLSGNGTNMASILLTETNGLQDTGIIPGVGNITSTRSLQADGAIDIVRAWDILAKAHGAEYEIDDAGYFHFVQSLGSDRSGSIHMVFRRDGQAGSNVKSISRGEDGGPMFNRIWGKTSGLAYRMRQDLVSQATYPLMVDYRQYDGALGNADLDAMIDADLSQCASPITDYQLEPGPASKKFDVRSGQRVMSGIQYGDVSVGDLITVTMVTENQDDITVKRIAEIAVEVDENLDERMLFTLAKPGVHITSAFLDATRVGELTRRIRELEAKV